MKKLWLFLLAFVLVFVLAACKEQETDPGIDPTVVQELRDEIARLEQEKEEILLENEELEEEIARLQAEIERLESELAEMEPPGDPEEGTMWIKDFLEADEEAVIIGIITSLAPYNSYSMEDKTGAVALRISGKNSSNIDFEVGDVIKAKVKKNVFKELIQAEVIDGEYEIVERNIKPLKQINLNEVENLDNDFLMKNQSRMVKADFATVVSVEADSYGTISLKIEIQELEILIRFDNRMPGFSSNELLKLEEGDEISFEKITISVYNTPQLMLERESDITKK